LSVPLSKPAGMATDSMLVGVVLDLFGRQQASTVQLRAGTKVPRCYQGGTKLPRCGCGLAPRFRGAARGRHQGSMVQLRASTRLPWCGKRPAPGFHGAAAGTTQQAGATSAPPAPCCATPQERRPGSKARYAASDVSAR
jgi:hypothetical protein